MKVLVTGGAGFIGSHLCEALLARGDEVYVIDDLSTGSIRNLDRCRENARCHISIGSIMDVPLVAELVDRADTVCHLAAAVGVRLIVESPVRTISTNIRGTEIILDLAAKKGKKVVLASTSEIYGKSGEIPFREDGDLLLGPTTKSRWSYACSKAIDEFLALAYWKERALPVVILRFFNTVGPRQTGVYGMVLPRFISQALSGEPITVYGSGEQTRCFLYVSDAVEGILALSDHPGAPGGVFNLGSEEEVTILRLAEMVLEITGSASPIRLVPYEEAYESGFEDMVRRVPDIGRARSLTGFEPKVGLAPTVRRTVEALRAEGGAA